MESDAGVTRTRRWGVRDAAAGVVVATLLVLLANGAALRGWPRDPQTALLLSYLVVWVPLCATVLLASRYRGARSLPVDFGWEFRPLDLLWGLTLGVLARLITGLLEIAAYGRLGSVGATFGEPAKDLWWLLLVVLCPIVFGPVIEELFFRGLLARAVQDAARRNGGSRRTALAIACLVSGIVFALVHLVSGGTPAGVAVVGVSTFILGSAAAALSLITRRLGGAIVAHITFNALVIVPALLA